MTPDACPVPAQPNETEEQLIRRLVRARRIAVVGLSDDPSRPSQDVASYLLAAGKEIIPVNPNHETVLGLPCFPNLRDVPGPIDLVDVFRRPDYCADVVRDALAVGAKAVWLQSGIVSAEAEQLAREAKIDFIQDRCLMVEHMRAK